MPALTHARAALIALVIAVGPGASVATAGLWSAPATLGNAAGSTLGDVAMDASGTAAVAWVANGGVLATVRPPGGVFSATATLAPDGSGRPAVALDGTGRALVAWTRDGSLELATRTPGTAGFTPVANAVTGVHGDPDVRFTDQGQAIVVWAGADGVIHALSYESGGGVAMLPDLSTGAGSAAPRLGASDGVAVAAWLTTDTAPNQVTTHVRAAVRNPGGGFAAPEEIASGTVVEQSQMQTGEQPSLTGVAVSEGGAIDALLGDVLFHGPPGDTAFEGLVAIRLPGASWTAPYRLGFADAPAQGGALAQDVAGGRGLDALYVAGEQPPASPTMTFSARLRAGASYGAPTTLLTGATGDVRVAALAPGRFVVLMRTASALTSRAGGPSSFDAPLRFTGTDGTRLIGIDGTRGGLAAAAWVTTAGRVDAAIYDDAVAHGSLPLAAGRDETVPVLSHLSVSPRRFPVHGRKRGTRVRWSLSEAARVVFRVDRLRSGFRHGSHCAAKRPRTARVRRCTRYVRVGAFTRTEPAGTRSLRFAGFVRGRPLRRGSYRLTAIATDAARHTAQAKRARFAVVRP